MTKKDAAQSNENARRDEPKLDSRYGEIGISAVAAALQYASCAKTDHAKKTDVANKTDGDETSGDAADALVRQQVKRLAELAA